METEPHASLAALLEHRSRFVEVSLGELEHAWGPDGILRIPAFQRSVVWDERRVALLWDSVLRGFPIGALLVTASPSLLVRPGQSSRSGQLDARLEAAGHGHLALLDGQQRAAALAAGWRPARPESTQDERLWIDLAFEPGRDARDTRKYALYACSTALPWGPGDENSDRRRAARDANIREFLRPAADRTPLSRTAPLAAGLPIPFAELRAAHATGELPNRWRDLLPEGWPSADEALAERTLTRLGAALGQADAYRVPVLRIDPSPQMTEGDQDDTDVLSEVFARLNSEGVPLDQAELFLSAVKARWPEALELISTVRDRAGGVLSAQHVVHLAVRLPAPATRAAAQHDIVRLTLREFHALEARLEGAGSGLQHALQPRLGDGAGSLADALKSVRATLSLQDEADDPGLPILGLVRIHWRAWHAMAAWLVEHGPEAVTPDDRLALLQYATLDRLLVASEGTEPIRVPVALALSTPERFPVDVIFQQLATAGQFTSPEAVERLLDELDAEDPPAQGAPLRNTEDILVWTQRVALDGWFRHYDTSRLLEVATRPWDIDHILAKARVDKRSFQGDPGSRFYAVRDRWRDDIGNLRVWPATLNREDRDRTLVKKFLVGDVAPPTDAVISQEPWCLPTPAAVRQASAFAGSDEAEETAAWAGADRSGEGVSWPDDRIVAFERAAWLRRRRLLRTFVRALRLRPLLEGLRGVAPKA